MQKLFPWAEFDFHPHNDYGLGLANAIYAVKSGINCIHCTMNCLGERAGNVSLAEVSVALKDQMGIKLDIDETHLLLVSEMVELFSGKRISKNSPIVGEDVFTQTSGIHADGDKKGKLYHNPIFPERFGRKRSYALGKMSGKSSLIKDVITRSKAADIPCEFSVSHTTRRPRDGDQEGKDYFFVAENEFEELIGNNTFIEYAKVHENYYGTAEDFVTSKLQEGINVFLEIDVQGFTQIQRTSIPNSSIFVLPPSMLELRNRITRRGLDSNLIIERRMKNAMFELSYADQYDFLIVNESFDAAIEELLEIIKDTQRIDSHREEKINLLI